MNGWELGALHRYVGQMTRMAVWCGNNHTGCDCVRLYQKRAADAQKEIATRGS